MYAFLRRVLASEAGHELYKHRKATVEPVFAQNKFNRGFRPIPATRQIRGAFGVAVPGSDPQPDEAPQPLDKPRDRLIARGGLVRGRSELSQQPGSAVDCRDFARQPPPTARRSTIEGAHLLGDEMGAASGAR
jgi:hypothetical protein